MYDLDTDAAESLAARFQALADPNRVFIVGLLARRAHFGEELAEVLGVKQATVSHHLQKLKHAGLVSSEKQSPYVLYRLRTEGLDELTVTLGSPLDLTEILQLPDENTISERVLRELIDDDGRLRTLPTQRRARAVVTRWLAQKFETGRIYPEREIHRVLLQVHDDCEELRRMLVDAGWFQRSGSVYRRIEEVEVE